MGLKKSKISGKIYFKFPNLDSEDEIIIPASNIQCAIRLDHTALGKKPGRILDTFCTKSDGSFSVIVKLSETEDVVVEMYSLTGSGYKISCFTDDAIPQIHRFLSEKKHVRHGENFSNYEICINDVNNPVNADLNCSKDEFIHSLSIITACRFAYQYVNKFCNVNKSLMIYYPAKNDKSWNLGQCIQIKAYKKYNKIGNFKREIFTTLHEFGHFVAYSLKFINASLGTHEDATNKTEETSNKTHGMHFAWNEGFAEFFSYYIYNRNPDFKKYFGDSYIQSIKKGDLTGESSEKSVECFLSFATFRYREVGPQFVTECDFWNALQKDKPKRIDDCINSLKKMNNNRKLLGQILSMSRIAPYNLSHKKDYISFANAGTENKLTKLNKFDIYIKTSGMTSFTKYHAKLEDLSVSGSIYKYTIKDSQILNRLNNGESLQAYIDGYQTNRFVSGPYTSEIYGCQKNDSNSSDESPNNSTNANESAKDPSIFKLNVTVTVADELGAGTDYKVYFKTIDKDSTEWSYYLNSNACVNDFERKSSRSYPVYFLDKKSEGRTLKIKELKEFRLTCAFSLKSQKFIISRVIVKDSSTGIILVDWNKRTVIKRDEPLVIPLNTNNLLNKYK